MRKHTPNTLISSLSGPILVLGLLCPLPNSALGASIDWLRGEAGDGVLAYQDSSGGVMYVSSGKIKLVELSTGQTITVGKGRTPEISPDASKIVWLDGNVVKGCERHKPQTVHVIAGGVKVDAGVHWYDNDEVLVVKGGKWKRVDLLGKNWKTVSALSQLGLGGPECDVRRTKSGSWIYTHGTTWKTSSGRYGSTGGTCGCSISPDGTRVTGLQPGHKRAAMTELTSKTYHNKNLDYAGLFDNPRWSSNDPRYVAALDETQHRMLVINVLTEKYTLLGTKGANRGDFSVGSGKGAAPWPTEGGGAKLSASPGSLQFRAPMGDVAPSGKTVEVTNAGDGVLDAVTVKSDAEWLELKVSGKGNSQSISNTVDLTDKAAGTYNASVTITAANAINGPTTYSVSFIVEPVATTDDPLITLVAPAAGASWEVGSTQYIKWTAQNVDDVRVYYSIDGGETFEELANTVGLEEPHWGYLPWTVPDVPSQDCMIRILGYFGEDPTNSASFAIVSKGTGTPAPGGDAEPVSPTPGNSNPGADLDQAADGLTVAGGCSVAPLRGSHPANIVWLLVLSALWLSRRRRQPMR